MAQQIVYFITFIGCVLLLFTGAMSVRLFSTRGSLPSGVSTLSDSPDVRKMLYTLIVAVGVCMVAAVLGIVVAAFRMF